jgi:16S rRNA (cytosine1402-N4)-methyltransferase
MHIPVLQKEVFQYLNPQSNENFIDCTIGSGGHTLAILEKNGPGGKVLGIDADLEQIENCKLKIENFKKRVILACDNFSNLKEIVKRKRFRNVQGILFDLGMSSWHLEESGRGFSFLKNEQLDMNFAQDKKRLTAKEIVNNWPVEEIEKILKEYGEERFVKKIALKIIENRKIEPIIKSTFQLIQIIKEAIPLWYQHQRIHFATRTFQALRIAVNNELDNLKIALPQALDILEPRGRLVVISFHSLEDRIVKHFFKSRTKFLKILTKKPISPSKKEVEINPRSRSAKLRAIIKNHEAQN